MKQFFYISLLLALLSSCDKENRCFDNPGVETSTDVNFSSDINTIRLNDDLHLLLVRDSSNHVTIIGGENMINNVLVEENNAMLTISNENKCLFVSKNDDITVEFHYTSLSELQLYGYGDVTSNSPITENTRINGSFCFSDIHLEFQNDSTFIALEGAPRIELSGSSNYLYAYSFGKGELDAFSLQTQTCHGHNSSLGDLNLRASQQYILELRSAGDIFLYDTTGTEIYLTHEGEGTIHYVP